MFGENSQDFFSAVGFLWVYFVTKGTDTIELAIVFGKERGATWNV